MSILTTIAELRKFSNVILQLGEPIRPELIEEVERQIGLRLPNDYKNLLSFHNGVTLLGIEIYGIRNQRFSLEECYRAEHFDVKNPMPKSLIPFSPDGQGNHYCFETNSTSDKISPIVFWQHDYHYTDDDLPEMVNQSLEEWILEVMIKWTLEDYNYDGTEKIQP